MLLRLADAALVVKAITRVALQSGVVTQLIPDSVLDWESPLAARLQDYRTLR